jgi:PAS domain S-box-containing protein
VLTSEEYRAVFEAAPDGVLVVCRDGLIKDCNPQIEALFGYAREELLGETVEILVPDVFKRSHAEHRSRFVRNPHTRPMGVGMDLRARRKDGSQFPVEISLSPWYTDQQGGLRVVCTVRDVTDRKRLRDFSEGALRSVEEERQRIARELHDDTAQRLATLLLRIRLLCRVGDKEERMAGLEEVREEILETAEGVKRIARGLRPPELADVGLTSAVQAHIRAVRESSGLEVHAEIEDVGQLLTEEGKLALYRIVQEALSNVVRHSGARRAQVRIWAAGDGVCALVEDRGRGFSLARVEEERGAGLGLVGMQERAVMLGGAVRVESDPGEGTRVRIELPAAAVEARNA